MLERVAFFVLICYSTASAQRNFFGNEVCHSDSECSGLTYCDPDFGCITSIGKLVLVIFGIAVAIGISCCVAVCVCIRCAQRKRTQYVTPLTPPSNYYVREAVVDMNPTTTQNVGYPQTYSQYPQYPTKQ